MSTPNPAAAEVDKRTQFFPVNNDPAICSSTASDIRTKLSNSGVVHLRQFFTPGDVEAIHQELNRLFDNFRFLPKQVQPKSDSNPGSTIREIANLIRHYPAFHQSPVYRKCSQLATDIFGRPSRYGFDHAIYKSPGSTAVHWHQDQFYSKYDRDKQCISFWIPLQPVTPANGGMQYVTGSSERLLTHTRVAPDSYMYHVSPEQMSNMSTVSPEMKPGDVCLHTPLTLHRSHPNTSTETRGAWIIQFNKYGPMRFARWKNLQQQLLRVLPD